MKAGNDRTEKFVEIKNGAKTKVLLLCKTSDFWDVHEFQNEFETYLNSEFSHALPAGNDTFSAPIGAHNRIEKRDAGLSLFATAKINIRESAIFKTELLVIPTAPLSVEKIIRTGDSPASFASEISTGNCWVASSLNLYANPMSNPPANRITAHPRAALLLYARCFSSRQRQ